MTQENRTRLVLLMTLALTAIRIPLAMLLNMALPDASVSPVLHFLASIGQSLVLFALPGWLLRPAWQTETSAPGDKWSWALLSVGVALAARGTITPLNAAWAQWLDVKGAPMMAAETLPEMALMLLALAVIPAIAEEMYFRGALLPQLLQSGSRWEALTATTLLFALMHGVLPGLPGHVLISLVLTLLMMHTGRLIIPVAVHMLFNLAAIWWPQTPAYIGWLCGGMLCALLVWLLIRLPVGRERCLTTEQGVLCAVIVAVMALQYLI